MNPSASGWIKKFGHLVEKEVKAFSNFGELYDELKKNGFVYGIHLDIPKFIKVAHALTEDEVAKINLLTALYYSNLFETGRSDFEEFVDTVFRYYQSLDVANISFLQKILSGRHTASQLEKLIDSRIYLGESALTRAFGNSLTNSLLFVDVLIFKYYLKNPKNTMRHAQQLEYVTMDIVQKALSSKKTHETDAKLSQLLEASLTYIDLNETELEGNYAELLHKKFTEYERSYFLDMACLTIWEDKSMDPSETDYILRLGNDLKKPKEDIENALKFVLDFFEKNGTRISYLNDKNLALQFYDGMSKNVSKLILRNSKRLKKELIESRELVTLLSQSTLRDLNPDERKKVQKQLIDIFKSIPSLAIFMLPGGAVLLPIFIKLIPKLLPSAFDENRVEDS